MFDEYVFSFMFSKIGISYKVKNGLQPIRLENGYEDKLVYVFPRSESEGLFEKWRKHELS